MSIRHHLVLLSVLVAGALLPAQTALPFHGLELDLPKGWTTQESDSVLLLVPPGWKAGEKTGEGFGLLFDADTKTLDGDEFESTIDGAAEAILDGIKRDGAVAKVKYGALDGRRFAYAMQNAEGQAIAMQIHVVQAKDGAVALFALGFPPKLEARAEALQAMLGSLRQEGQKPKKRAFGMGGNKPPKPAEGGDQPEPKEEPKPRLQDPEAGEAPPAKTEPATDETPKAAPAARLPGSKATTWKGMQFDLPKGWTTKSGDDGALGVLPPGFGQSGVLDEIYVLVGDGSIRSLDEPDLDQKVQEGLDQLQPGLMQDGEPKAAKFGNLKGRIYTFRGPAQDGQDAMARIYAFPTAGGVCALLGLGFPQKLQAREKEVLAMLATLRPAKAGAAAGGGVAPELVGQWSYFANFNAVNGGGRMSSTTLTLRADGTYTYAAETTSSNPFGGAGTQENDSGRWSLQGDSLVFQSVSGQQSSYRLEKRNHPKNNDPMILLDGKPFVTATQKAPW